MQVLDVLKKGKEKFGKKGPKQENVEKETATEDESVCENPESKYQRYMNCGMSEVSEPDLWQMWHHGVPSVSDPPSDHRRYADDHMHQIMRRGADADSSKSMMRHRTPMTSRPWNTLIARSMNVLA